jgi:hypothetical protein
MYSKNILFLTQSSKKRPKFVPLDYNTPLKIVDNSWKIACYIIQRSITKSLQAENEKSRV